MAKLNVTISKTSRGDQDYMQIMSADFEVNIVLIGDVIEVKDTRSRTALALKEGNKV